MQDNELHPPLGVVVEEKGAFGLSLTMVTNFTYIICRALQKLQNAYRSSQMGSLWTCTIMMTKIKIKLMKNVHKLLLSHQSYFCVYTCIFWTNWIQMIFEIINHCVMRGTFTHEVLVVINPWNIMTNYRQKQQGILTIA